MKKNQVLFSVIAIWLAIISCNLPGAQGTQEATNLSVEQLAGTLTALASASQTPSATFTPVGSAPLATETATLTSTPCSPTAVANTNANIRNGPGTVYKAIDAVTAGTSVSIAGKNAESTWWYIVYPSTAGGYAWVAMSVVNASCI